jgi:hypothetical protein
MGAAVVTLPTGVLAGGPATRFISANMRVKSQLGYLGIQTDVVIFSGPAVSGMWTSASSRVFVNSIPIVTKNSQGQAVTGSGAAITMTVVAGDPRVNGS